MQRIYPNFHDYYSCHLPTDIYERYQNKRLQYNKENIASLKNAQKDKNNGGELEDGWE